jgi:hypothetical protein
LVLVFRSVVRWVDLAHSSVASHLELNLEPIPCLQDNLASVEAKLVSQARHSTVWLIRSASDSTNSPALHLEWDH